MTDLVEAPTQTGEQVKAQAAGRLRQLGSAARHDDPRHWRALGTCLIAVVATAIDPPILQATSSAVLGALRVEPETSAQFVGLYCTVQTGTMVAAGVLADGHGSPRMLHGHP